jgi:hypothetical protein
MRDDVTVWLDVVTGRTGASANDRLTAISSVPLLTGRGRLLPGGSERCSVRAKRVSIQINGDGVPPITAERLMTPTGAPCAVGLLPCCSGAISCRIGREAS